MSQKQLMTHLLDTPASLARSELLRKVALSKFPMVEQFLNLVPDEFEGTIREWITGDGLQQIIGKVISDFGSSQNEVLNIVEQCPHCSGYFCR